MFERRFQLKQLWCGVWLCACATAAAQQSNQPFDIEHLSDDRGAVRIIRPREPKLTKPSEPDAPRLTRLAQKWADGSDTPPGPQVPTAPRFPQAQQAAVAWSDCFAGRYGSNRFGCTVGCVDRSGRTSASGTTKPRSGW